MAPLELKRKHVPHRSNSALTELFTGERLQSFFFSHCSGDGGGNIKKAPPLTGVQTSLPSPAWMFNQCPDRGLRGPYLLRRGGFNLLQRFRIGGEQNKRSELRLFFFFRSAARSWWVVLLRDEEETVHFSQLGDLLQTVEGEGG